ncbi:hypothetical protein DMJ13_17265 [halophilic archaeon]|nr:hypothetical protein DMJ13_17265 [halophilic archaeon]
MSRTVFTIGLDGVPPRFVKHGIAEGYLPTLKKIRNEGIGGRTRSTRPPLSMMAWSTFATGQNPGNHGIYNFILKDSKGSGVEFANSKHLRSNSIPMWEYLDAEGISTGVMNVMPGYPPSKTSGFHISDHITTPPNAQYTYPHEIQEKISEVVDDFDIGPITGYTPGDGEEDLREYLDNFFNIEEDRIKVTKYLIEEHPAKAMLLIFSGPDILLHEVGHLLDSDHPKYNEYLADQYGDAPFELLELYDSFLSWLLDEMGDDDVLMVLSDHGHGPVYDAVNLNSWLYQNNYLDLNKSILTKSKAFAFNHLFDTAEHILKQTNLYDKVKLHIARSNNGGGSFELADLLTISQDDIDWSTTSAFTVAGDGQIFINEKVISGREYDSFRDKLRNDLLSMTNPKRSEKILEDVLYGEDVYKGSFTETRPDLVCIPKPTYRLKFPQTMKTNQFIVKPQKWFSHTSEAEMDGIFYMCGSNVATKSGVEVNLTDFAPTILQLLNVPIPKEMDGEVRSEFFSSTMNPVEKPLNGKVQTKRAIRSVTQDILHMSTND